MAPRGYYSAKMAELRDRFGGKCDRCGSSECLEFAHRAPNGLSGRGRGMPQRYHDIKKHTGNYRIDHELGDKPPF